MGDLVERLREWAHRIHTADAATIMSDITVATASDVRLKALIEAAEAITALQSQLAEARAERDALVAVAGDAYYVLTYTEALSNDEATKAACAEVRTKIDAIKEQAP
jgi:hypothetical protein